MKNGNWESARKVRAFLSVWFSWGCIGCGDSSIACNFMGWSHTIRMTLQPPVEAESSCKIQVAADSLQEACSVAIADTAEATCSDHLAVLSSDGSATLNDVGIVLVTLGDGETVPDSFELSVTVDNGVITTQTITPDYQVDEPNGDGCGERKQATVTVELSSS